MPRFRASGPFVLDAGRSRQAGHLGWATANWNRFDQRLPRASDTGLWLADRLNAGVSTLLPPPSTPVDW